MIKMHCCCLMSDGLMCVCLPQTPSAWADECGEKKRGCHKRSASCGSTDQLKEVRTRLGPDLLSSPGLCSIQRGAGPGLDPLVVFLSPSCEIVDEETGQQQAVGGDGEGKIEAVSLSYYWQALAKQCHLALHPPFLLFVWATFLPSLCVSPLCPLSFRLSQVSGHALSSCHLLSQLPSLNTRSTLNSSVCSGAPLHS